MGTMHAVACSFVLLLAAASTAHAGFRGSGGSRTSGSSYRPPVGAPYMPAAPSSYRPAAPSSYRPPATPSFFGTSAATSPGGYRYSRPGYRPTSLIVPLAAGAVAGSAMASLHSNQNAYCNGFSVQCYKTACQQAVSKCSATNSTTLVVATCPDPRFSECWQTDDTIFQCFGKRRPRFGTEDLAVYCNQPDSNTVTFSNAAASRQQLNGVLMMTLILVGALLV